MAVSLLLIVLAAIEVTAVVGGRLFGEKALRKIGKRSGHTHALTTRISATAAMNVPGMYEEILPENSQRRIKTLVRFQFVFAANNRKISMLNKNQDQAVFMYFLKLNKI